MTSQSTTARPSRSRFPQTAAEQLAGRLHAAKVNGGAAVATPRGNGRYGVTGRAETRYTVHLIGDRAFCDCKAGSFGRPCWHAAAAWLRRLADTAVAG